jgi:hypothetical protein
MTKEPHAHVPMTGDELDVAMSALVCYAAEMRKSAGPTSTSAAIADELARRMATARRDVR